MKGVPCPMRPNFSEARPPRLIENLSLALTAILAHAPLYYQLPRWRNGLDPTFVHPDWIASSPLPFVVHLAAIHPLLWITLIILIFLRLWRNYGWKLSGSCRLPDPLDDGSTRLP